MARTDAATHERLRRAADRQADNPVKLASAQRIVQAAIGDERVSLEEHIRLLVDAAPPLTSDQRDRLARLLRPTA